MVTDKFGEPVTEERWLLVEGAIKAFIRTYPLHWRLFKKDLLDNETKYQEAFEGDLKRASWRNTSAFPVIYRRKPPPKEGDWQDPSEDPYEEIDSLYPILARLLPGLTEADKPGKPNKLYREFLRRFPIFLPGSKY